MKLEHLSEPLSVMDHMSQKRRTAWPIRMSCNEFEKQMVLLYDSIQCGRIAEYLLGPNSKSSIVMLSWCCYMDLRH